MIKERPNRGQDLTGRKFGRLSVIRFDLFYRSVKRPKERMAKWKCLCECGVKLSVYGSNLLKGNSRSCGCLSSELASKRALIHGHSRKLVPQHPLYGVWLAMNRRCNNKNVKGYKWYGARGIKVCARWRDFTLFLKDMESSWKRGLTLERKDNNGNYEPSNCKWATYKEQANNTSANHILESNGERLSIAQWADKLDINVASLYSRVQMGWSDDRIVNTPIRQ